uniref:Uncharacterized protein n=1 Tax=Oryza meridionalis TaxID=40149 RepID=A0A0E0EJY4_9ORYZ
MHIRLAQPLYVKNFTTIDGRGADVHVAGGAGIVGNRMPAVARRGGGGGKDQWHWHSVGDAFENGAFFRQEKHPDRKDIQFSATKLSEIIQNTDSRMKRKETQPTIKAE